MRQECRQHNCRFCDVKSAHTPPQVKCELGRVRRSIRHIGAPCSARHSHGVTGALLPVFGFAVRTRGAKPNFFGVLPPSATASPRVKFGASAGVLDAPDGH